MRIALDVRRMSDFGVATYLRNVVRTLGRIDQTNEYFLIGNVEKLARQVGELPSNFTSIPFESDAVTPSVYLDYRRTVKHFACDVIHVPHTFWRPLPVSCPYIMTVHDLLDYMYRAKTRSGLSRILHFYLTRQVMKRAARLFAVSNFTKKDLERFFQISPTKIEVIHNALDEKFALGHTTEDERRTLEERYQVNYPFVLYAGRISPHKNVARIIESFSALKSELAKDGILPDLKLIIIGDEVSKHPDLRRAVVRAGMQYDVRFLGFVPIEVLRIFYDAAKVFVFPSLYEGFGLPPLEAMAHGTPVIASNTSALPEVVGSAALLVNPENIFEISRALHRSITDPDLRARLKDAGKQQVQRYSWEKSVRKMISVYEEVASHKGRGDFPK